MGEFYIGTKIVFRKTCMGLEKGDLQDVSNIITQLFTCFMPFEWAHSVDFLSAEGSKDLYTR